MKGFTIRKGKYLLWIVTHPELLHVKLAIPVKVLKARTKMVGIEIPSGEVSWVEREDLHQDDSAENMFARWKVVEE